MSLNAKAKSQAAVRDDDSETSVHDESPVTTSRRPPMAGMVLPEGFVNPERGEQGHLCLDPEGRYQPTWSCVNISRNKENPERQHFLDEQGQSIRVQTDMWVDVPPTVISTLRTLRIPTIIRNGASGEGLTRALQEQVLHSTPRFQFSVIPSS